MTRALAASIAHLPPAHAGIASEAVRREREEARGANPAPRSFWPCRVHQAENSMKATKAALRTTTANPTSSMISIRARGMRHRWRQSSGSVDLDQGRSASRLALHVVRAPST